MPLPEKRDECSCGQLERMANEPGESIEFDARLNEYHIMRRDGLGYSLIYFCPFCGRPAPASQRDRLFQQLTDAEHHRLTTLTKDLRTVKDVIAAFGEADLKGQCMTVTTPEKEGKPETTQAYPVMSYSKLSETALVNVQVYPDDRVGITFQGKPMLVRQREEIHVAPGAKPESVPQIDTSKRYDVYCIEPGRQSVVYRNALFKGAAALLPQPGGRLHYPDFVELEQANGQSVFIPRSSILRFCEPGTAVNGEAITPDRPDGR